MKEQKEQVVQLNQKDDQTGDTSSGKTLYLIDGYAAIFRAFFAIRHPLHSPITGEPTQAVLVFAQMLLKLYATFKPDYVAVALDAPGATFREELYAEYVRTAATIAGTPPPAPRDATVQSPTPLIIQEKLPSPIPAPAEIEPGVEPIIESITEPSYKGTRRSTPDSLNQQVGRIEELLSLLSIPVISQPGLEADDIIATITHRLVADPAYPDLRIRIVSRDKDLEQLLGERVTLFDIHTGVEMDQAALRTKRGITPEQLVDFLTLTGDAVDNIPGVPGIGPRTAAKLLGEFGSLAGIIDNLPHLRDRWRESLEKAQLLLPISRRLVTLKNDAAFPFSLEKGRVRPVPVPEIARLFDELGFHRLKEQLPLPPPAASL